MKMRLLSARQLEGLVPMEVASEATKFAFRELSLGRVSAPDRMHVDQDRVGGKTLLMGAHLPGRGLASKIVSYFPGNRAAGSPAISGLVVVLNEATGEPSALLDGSWLTAFRTGAGTSASIDVLARADARQGALFGTGGQAAMQLVGMDAARRLERIRVFSPRPDRAIRFSENTQSLVRARLEPVTDPRDAVAGADVVVTATSSDAPVFAGQDLEPGCHVTAIGGIRLSTQEVDTTTLARSRVFVDSRSGALSESGELHQALSAGVLAESDICELGAVVENPTLGRRNAAELTFYKSVGHAVQDVAIAALLVARAEELGLGEEIEL